MNNEYIIGRRLTDSESTRMLYTNTTLISKSKFDEVLKPFIKQCDYKLVSTIPDECMGVGLEISTSDVLGNESSSTEAEDTSVK